VFPVICALAIFNLPVLRPRACMDVWENFDSHFPAPVTETDEVLPPIA